MEEVTQPLNVCCYSFIKMKCNLDISGHKTRVFYLNVGVLRRGGRGARLASGSLFCQEIPVWTRALITGLMGV